jgi:chloramphenicol 3-O-phosphotransferase
MHLINQIKVGLLLVVAMLIGACSNKSNSGHGKVIIVNGKTSSEKTSIIAAFLAKNDQGWITIQIPAVCTHSGKIDLDDDKIKGLHLTVASLAQKGGNVIVDYESQDSRFMAHLQKALSDIPTFVVGVKTNNDQHDAVHNGWRYNMDINISDMLPEQAAERISQYIEFKCGIAEMEQASQQSCFLGTTLKK